MGLFKYIDRFWKNGRWNYVYSGKDVVKKGKAVGDPLKEARKGSVTATNKMMLKKFGSNGAKAAEWLANYGIDLNKKNTNKLMADKAINAQRKRGQQQTEYQRTLRRNEAIKKSKSQRKVDVKKNQMLGRADRLRKESMELQRQERLRNYRKGREEITSKKKKEVPLSAGFGRVLDSDKKKTKKKRTVRLTAGAGRYL